MSENKKKGLAYGWLIVLGCMLIQAIPFGVATNIHPQFTSYVVNGEGFKLASFSLMFTIGTVASAVMSPVIGKTFTKHPAKLIFIIGSIVSAGGVFILSFAHALPMFYLGYAVAQVGIAAISSIGVPLLITAWFDETSKGKALGLAFAGGSIGNVFLQSAVVALLAKVGYSRSYFIFATIALVVGVVISFAIIRTPKDESEIIRGKDSDNTSTNSVEDSNWGYTFGEVSKMKTYWVYAIGFVFVGLYVSALALQFPVYLSSINFDHKTLGLVGSAFALASLLGNMAGGILFDKIGMIKSMLIAGLLVAVSCVALIFAPQLPALAFVFAICKGLSVYAYMLGPSFLAGSLFGKKDFGTILAVSNVFFALGFAFGTPVFGLMVDKFGYAFGWSTILAYIIIAYVMILSAIKTFSKLNVKKKSEAQNNIA